MRAAKLAHEGADRLAHRGRAEVKLPSLGRAEIVGFDRPQIVGFEVSTEAQSQFTVQVAQTQEHAAKEQRSEQARRSEQWWTVRIGVVTALILGFQLWVFGRQAKRLRETIETMERIAKAQGKDMETSIAESARAATAMEDLTRVTSANRPLFEKLSKVANRAYLAVAFDGATPQDDMNLFEGGAAVINSGNTPALNVRFKAAADILPLSSLADFGFPLPAESEATSISVMGPRMPPRTCAAPRQLARSSGTGV